MSKPLPPHNRNKDVMHEHHKEWLTLRGCICRPVGWTRKHRRARLKLRRLARAGRPMSGARRDAHLARAMS